MNMGKTKKKTKKKTTGGGWFNLRQLDRAEARVVAVNIRKGGAGKTAIVEGLAVVLAGFHKKRIAFVDLDPQMNLTARLGAIDAAGRLGRNIGEALDTADPVQALQDHFMVGKLQRIAERFGILPGSKALDDYMKKMKSAEDRGELGDLWNRLGAMTDQIRPFYDFILIDTPPALATGPTNMALAAADDLIVPLTDLDCLGGLGDILQRLKAVQKLRDTYGRDPLNITIMCPNLVRDAPKEVRAGLRPDDPANANWHPLVEEYLSDWFVGDVVRHSATLVGARQHSSTFSGMSPAVRADYKRLTATFLRMQAAPPPSLHQAVLEGTFPLDEFRARVAEANVKTQASEFRAAKFHWPETTPVEGDDADDDVTLPPSSPSPSATAYAAPA